MKYETLDERIFDGLDHALNRKQERRYNKSIFEAKYGKKRFVDSLSEQKAYKDYADRVINNLEF